MSKRDGASRVGHTAWQVTAAVVAANWLRDQAGIELPPASIEVALASLLSLGKNLVVGLRRRHQWIDEAFEAFDCGEDNEDD